ncbi:MAG: CoA-binding protein [Candidatus Tectomicrobia bacterium]|nr:CoA-binding protein [Candidatus Tectomicrobia bacterium]
MDHDRRDLLRRTLNPRSVAILGASSRSLSVGYSAVDSVLGSGFPGPVYLVNPKYEVIHGQRCFASLRAVGAPIDLVIIALRKEQIIPALRECGELGIRSVLCMSAGFGESGGGGQALEDELRRVAEELGILLIGPNTLGFHNPHLPLNATFWPKKLPAGGVAVLSQSGGTGVNVLCAFLAAGVGISTFVGVGNRTVLEFHDYIDYLAEDDATTVIGVVIEGVRTARAFIESVRRALARKPVVVWKVGSTDVASAAALTHTGGIAGARELWDAALRQSGAVAVGGSSEFVAACKALALAPLPRGPRVCVMTHTSGPSIIAADILARHGWPLPELGQPLIDTLDRTVKLGGLVLLQNPIDLSSPGASARPWCDAAEVLFQADFADAYLFIFNVHKHFRAPTDGLRRLCEMYRKPVVVNYLADADEMRHEAPPLQAVGVPVFHTPDEAAHATHALLRYGNLRRG